MSLLHQRKRSKASLSDEWETPQELFNELCRMYKVYPDVDVCASEKTTKCDLYINKKMDALKQHWTRDSWCNPPHSMTAQFVEKAWNEWLVWNCTIMMIIPANTVSSKYFAKYVNNCAEVHPIEGRIRFLVRGKPSKYPSRNAYICVIWRPQDES